MYTKAADISSNGSYAVSVTSIGTGAFIDNLSFNEWIMLGGFLLGVATYLTNLYFRIKQDKREQGKL